ncbi:tubulin tyrosine ligase, partial [Angomonas deanei]
MGITSGRGSRASSTTRTEKPRQADTGTEVLTESDSGSDLVPQVKRRKESTVKTTYPVVEPLFSASSASLFFPIYYGRASVRDKKDPRGLPQQINEELHPNDRSGLRLSSVSVQKDNLNRMGLYKIGPGAVAFSVVINAFEAAGLQYTPSNELFNILWAKRATPYTLASLTPYQKVNHFPGSWGLGRKDSLTQNVAKMKRYFGNEVFDIAPTSFLIPRQKNELLQDAEQYPGTEENPLIYIIKPSASSCGRGIYLHKGVPPMPRGTKQMVCQRYIGNPLLIFGRKFDLRLYCVVTSFDPLRIFLFDEGLVRFAAEKYPGPDKELDNIHMHLTNYSVNKTAELSRASRGKDFDGEDAVDIKWCISDFKKHLQKEHPLGIAAWNAIEKECDDVVTKAFLSIEHDVIERLRMECKDKTGRCCFELFGLDLMADENLKV